MNTINKLSNAEITIVICNPRVYTYINVINVLEGRFGNVKQHTNRQTRLMKKAFASANHLMSLLTAINKKTKITSTTSKHLLYRMYKWRKARGRF